MRGAIVNLTFSVGRVCAFRHTAAILRSLLQIDLTQYLENIQSEAETAMVLCGREIRRVRFFETSRESGRQSLSLKFKRLCRDLMEKLHAGVHRMGDFTGVIAFHLLRGDDRVGGPGAL